MRNDHRPFARAVQLLRTMRGVRRRKDNSRGQVHNVGGDTSAICTAVVRKNSRRDRLEVVLVMKATENGSGNDAMSV